ncbi:hypothetical protein V0288_21500 [Pannus brasiliensis CCIBt3594]|uniref:Uncharacterized protein n=1 Tax=Pannus brasiliensis CCIBt3594 TaxID=1427578 RepID=A0AAW9R0F2_9CHRO
MFLVNRLLASDSLPSPANIQTDPLIDRPVRAIIYLGILLLVLVGVSVIGFLSRRFEYAIAFALLLSLGLIGLFFLFQNTGFL